MAQLPTRLELVERPPRFGRQFHRRPLRRPAGRPEEGRPPSAHRPHGEALPVSQEPQLPLGPAQVYQAH